MRPAAKELEAALWSARGVLAAGPLGWAVEAIGAVSGLFPEEEQHVAAAVERRRGEFSAGRRAARGALARAGGPQVALGVGRFGEPLWPEGFAGSISHDGRFAVALAYRWPQAGTRVAVDLIDRREFEDFLEILPSIRHERDPLSPPGDGRAVARLFAAKEAAIKLLSPVAGAFVEFRDLRAAPSPEGFRVLSGLSADPIEVRMTDPGGMILALATSTVSTRATT